MKDPSATEKALLSDFFAHEYGLPDAVILDDLATFLECRLRRSLPCEVVRDLQEAEDQNRIEDFMSLLVKHRPVLGKANVNYLYHRWIRLIVLRFHGFDQYEGVEKIPTVFIPYYPYLDAFITRTPNRFVICFSEAQNDAILRLFRIIMNSTRFHELTPDEPTWPVERTRRYLNDLASAVARGWRGDVPCPAQAGPVRTTIVDNFNNTLQAFILAHEYAHFALGHLSRPNHRERNVQRVDAKSMRAYDPDIEEELAADMLAMKHLRQPRGGENWQQYNAVLFNSALQFFWFLGLCRKHLGLPLTLPGEDARLLQMGEFLFEESDQAIVFEELHALKAAVYETETEIDREETENG